MSCAATGARDTVSGGEGDDLLFGNPGDDSLDGNGGTNTLNGGFGTDPCVNGPTFIRCELSPPRKGRCAKSLGCG